MVLTIITGRRIVIFLRLLGCWSHKNGFCHFWGCFSQHKPSLWKLPINYRHLHISFEGSYCVLAILKVACLTFWKEDLHVSWILLTSNKGTVCIFTDTNKPVPGIQSRVLTVLCESSPPSYTSPSKSSGGKNKRHKLCLSAFLTFQRPSAGLLASLVNLRTWKTNTQYCFSYWGKGVIWDAQQIGSKVL